MLLPPAGLLGASPTSSTTASTMFLSVADRSSLRVPSAHPRRPPIKRTASTASVSEVGELNLPPEEQARDRGEDVSSDDEEERERDQEMDMGMQEDWVPEEEKDPFSATPPGSASRSGMFLDTTPSSSPTPYRRPGKPAQSSSTGKDGLDSDDEDRDDAANNPFFTARNGDPPRAPTKRRKNEGPADASRQKVSYVLWAIYLSSPIPQLY